MASQNQKSWQYIGSAAIKKGTMLKLHTVAGQCDVATGVTDVPCGIALEDAAAGNSTPQNIGVGSINGEVYKVIASTAIAIGVQLGPTTGGQAITIALTTTYAQEWVWGTALTAVTATSGGQIVELMYNPQIAS